MQSSSLIFVLVVAIWAVYLLQYWIRRRDHLSTVRSVDRFSAAMRILDDHRLRGETVEPTPRSYAVAPTRGVRPEITVKHAQRPHRPLVEPVVGASRKARGLTLLTMLVLLPVVVLVAAVGPVSWWLVPAWLVATAVAFGWLRQGVSAERDARARAHAHARQRRTAAPRAAAPRAAAPPTRSAPAPRDITERPVRRRETQVYDVAEVTRTAKGSAIPESAPETDSAAEPEPATTESATPTSATADAPTPAPGTWQPTPVPRPMYTLKAKAPRPQPAPFEDNLGQTPQVIDVEDEELPAIAGWG